MSGVVAVVAAVLRRGMVPADGLWFDDSWVAAGATFGGPSQLLAVGSTHPSFTLSLMGIDRLGGGPSAMVLPALVAGVAAPVLLYVLARRCGLARGAAAVAAAALATAAIPIVYAGRVKPYTVDVVGVLVVAAALPIATRARWRWPHAAGWVAAAWLLGGTSAPMLLVTAVAGGTVVVLAAGDRVVRAVVVAVQGAGQAAWLLAVRSRADFSGIDRDIRALYDPYPQLGLDPGGSIAELRQHFGRVGELLSGSGGSPGLLLAASIVGLAVAAAIGRTRPERVVGGFLLALTGAAFVGSVAGVVPFGGDNVQLVSFGGRYNLWLVAPMAFGIAAGLHHLLELLRGRARLLAGSALLVVAAGVLLRDGLPAGPQPPGQGAESAAAHLDSALGPADVAVILPTSSYSYPLHSEHDVELVLDRRIQVGFALRPLDERFLTIGPWSADPGSVESLDALIAGTDRVLVIGAGPNFGMVNIVDAALVEAGFELEGSEAFEWNVVWEWRRPER